MKLWFNKGAKMTKARVLSLLLVSVIAISLEGIAQEGKQGKKLETATFAGGCFWCMESPFEDLPGVVSVTSGYTGGQKKDPTYEEVSAGGTGHAESVEIIFDPMKIGYKQLLEVFWHNIDPTTPNQQFCDRGSQYRSAIFYHDKTQQQLAEESKKKIEAMPKFNRKVFTQVLQASVFYPAEEYHQDFHKKNPIRYNAYRFGCGRDRRLKELWGENK